MLVDLTLRRHASVHKHIPFPRVSMHIAKQEHLILFVTLFD